MRYRIDHDYHIHSLLSTCSNDPLQTKERILRYAEEYGLHTVCLTNHYWDSEVDGCSEWYFNQNFEHVSKALPLPQSEKVKFLFGCETEMDKFMRLGMPLKRFDDFEFVILPTTHMHIQLVVSEQDAQSLDRRAELWVERLQSVLNMPLPFHKIGIAHLACRLIEKTSREKYLSVLERIPTEAMECLFQQASQKGVGIELNRGDMSFSDEEAEIVLRPFRIAKAQGCKFYCGSDAHHPDALEDFKEILERAVDRLGLTEQDKFHIGK
ncbi:MAG: hypothetical protein J6A38_01835 [Clostridia bacterium]|nr:hypothetical protein [Clostridia bacterium]